MALIKRQEAADKLGVSLRTVDGLIRRGQLRAYRIGPKIVRIDETDLQIFLASRQVAPEVKKAEPPVRPCRYVPGMRVV